MRQIRYLIFFFCLLCSFSSFAVGIGQPAPAFERMPLIGGQPIALADYKGKVVYLDFWASWCGPCRQSMPLLTKIHDDLAREGFTVLAVNLDAYVEEALNFLRNHPVSYPVVRDTGGVLPQIYGMNGMPTAYLIDRNGIIRYIHHGFRRSDGPEIREAIEALIKEPA